MTVIIFSKNRAMQLDALLQSINLNSSWIFSENLFIIYQADKEHLKSYKTLAKDYLGQFIFQDGLTIGECLRKLIGKNQTEYYLFFTDDNILINNFSYQKLEKLLKIYDNEIHAVSLRMHKDIDFCEPARQPMKKPEIKEIEDVIFWSWQEPGINPHTCWGYPTSINSHVYKAEYIEPILRSWSSAGNVNDLEAHLNRNRDYTKKYMIAPDQPIVFDVMANTVRTSGDQYSSFGVNDLLVLFESGKRINIQPLQCLKINSAHGKIEYQFESKQ